MHNYAYCNMNYCRSKKIILQYENTSTIFKADDFSPTLKTERGISPYGLGRGGAIWTHE